MTVVFLAMGLWCWERRASSCRRAERAGGSGGSPSTSGGSIGLRRYMSSMKAGLPQVRPLASPWPVWMKLLRRGRLMSRGLLRHRDSQAQRGKSPIRKVRWLWPFHQ
uniref:Putative secreted protein n=1 Tax=Ixodes ricinus TaxID=34613 RepID=A0A6B0UI39_IXORI